MSIFVGLVINYILFLAKIFVNTLTDNIYNDLRNSIVKSGVSDRIYAGGDIAALKTAAYERRRKTFFLVSCAFALR